MIILGVDPGYDRCGLAIVRKEPGAREVLLYSDCVTTNAGMPFEDRLTAVGKECERLLTEYSPDVVALEKVYFTSNQKTAMRVAEIRGMLIYVARSHAVPVREYGPNEIKSAIAGDGRADKRQVMLMVPRLIRVEKTVTYDDEYDAIAVSLTAAAILSSHTLKRE